MADFPYHWRRGIRVSPLPVESPRALSAKDVSFGEWGKRRWGLLFLFSCPSLFFPFSSLVLGLGFLFWVWGFSISLLSSTTGDQLGSKSLKIYRHLRPTIFPRGFPCFPFRSFVSTLSLLGLRRSYPYSISMYIIGNGRQL